MLDKWVSDAVTELYRRTGEPVSTIALSTRLGRGDRDCRRFLVALEKKGKVARVGERGGWVPMSVVDELRKALNEANETIDRLTDANAAAQIQMVLRRLEPRRPAITTAQAAAQTGLSVSQVTRYLRRGWWEGEQDEFGRWWIYADQELTRRPRSLPPIRTPNGWMRRTYPKRVG